MPRLIAGLAADRCFGRRRRLDSSRSRALARTTGLRRIALSAYAERLEALAAEAADRCTTCGKCFEACPTAREIGLDAGAAKERVGELLALTRGEAPADGLQKWLGACDGSARCTDACPEDINVRQWVTIAKMKALEATRPRAEVRRGQCRQPLPPHGAGRAAARQHAAAVGDAEEDPGAGRAAHRRRAVLYRLQRAAHAAHRAERHGHPRRARARLRRGRRHRPLLRRLPVPGSRPADLRAHGPSHLPALRPVRRRQGADLVPDLHQELRRAGEGRRGSRPSISATSANSWPPTSMR